MVIDFVSVEVVGDFDKQFQSGKQKQGWNGLMSETSWGNKAGVYRLIF